MIRTYNNNKLKCDESFTNAILTKYNYFHRNKYGFMFLIKYSNGAITINLLMFISIVPVVDEVVRTAIFLHATLTIHY